MQKNNINSDIDDLPELTASAIDHNIDTICIQENRYIQNGDIK